MALYLRIPDANVKFWIAGDGAGGMVRLNARMNDLAENAAKTIVARLTDMEPPDARPADKPAPDPSKK